MKLILAAGEPPSNPGGKENNTNDVVGLGHRTNLRLRAPYPGVCPEMYAYTSDVLFYSYRHTVKKADGNFLNYRTFPLPLMENIPSGKAK
jgi:hypothetical protein